MNELSILFGVKTTDIEEAKKWIEESTKIELEPFHNDYVGDYYMTGNFGPGEKLKLSPGLVEEEEETYPLEEEFSEWSLLLFVSESHQGSDVLKALERRTNLFEKLRMNEYKTR